MSNYIGYRPEDNARRKANNTGDSLGWGPNQNSKSYSTKPGSLSAREQAESQAKQDLARNRKQPVKSLKDCKTLEERMEFLRTRGLDTESLAA